MAPDEQQARISRRGLIKGVGAGTAIVWAAPVITGASSVAFAASPTCAAPCTTCFSTGCPPASTACGNNCLCSQTAEGECFCAQDIFGSGECTSSAQCLPNERCMNICAFGCAGSFCLPGCDVTTVTSSREGKPSSSA